MNKLMVNEEIKTISSREVAEMMEIRHTELLRKIDGINKTFTKRKIALSKYWIESSYKDKSGKENRCFEVTKLGCEFLANKSTGEKGIVFTDRYMTRFEEMKNIINSNEQLKANLLLNIYNGGQDGILAARQLTDLEVKEATKPLIDIIDNVLLDDGLYDIGLIGKILKPYNKDFGAKKIFNYLRDESILIDAEGTHKHNTPYDRYSNYFIVKPIVVHKGSFDVCTTKTYFNGKGVKYLLNKLAKNNMINPRDKNNIIDQIIAEKTA